MSPGSSCSLLERRPGLEPIALELGAGPSVNSSVTFYQCLDLFETSVPEQPNVLSQDFQQPAGKKVEVGIESAVGLRESGNQAKTLPSKIETSTNHY